jgi:N-methylhydantoinase A
VSEATHWLGIDVGGTFTDLVLVTPGASTFQVKVPSTPPDFDVGVVAGVDQILTDAGVAANELGAIVHGTTVATNAILERRGARTAMVVTKGFRDVLELTRLRHPDLYDVQWEKPPPLVPRSLRFEVDERSDHAGGVLRPLLSAERDRVVGLLKREDVEAVAVCFLNSHAAPGHEDEFVADLKAKVPHVQVTSSAELVPEIREYERWSTAVVNAYVQPLVSGYLERLEQQLSTRGFGGDLLVMQSSGGLLDVATARLKPARLIESGPAAGVIAATKLVRDCSLEDAITFDMGGTTAKAALIEGGRPFEAAEFEVGGGMSYRRGVLSGAGYAVRVSSIDIAEVGAGGGSVVWIDAGGVPHVGPESAGAVPGPACYGRGGTRPTVTDANVVLGYYGSHGLAGGAQRISCEAAEDAIRTAVAEPLGLTTLEGAFGVHTIVSTAMTSAIRAVSTERGRDPRNYCLVAFGGAGPAHAARMAEELGIRRVLVPPGPGLFSAVGLLVAERHMDFTLSYAGRADLDLERINAALAELRTRAADALRSTTAGLAVREDAFADIRYFGQSSELRVPVAAMPLDPAALGRLRRDFDAQHQQTYGHNSPDHPIEVVNLRVRVSRAAPGGDQATPAPAAFEPPGSGRERTAYFGPEVGSLDVPVIARHQLDSTPSQGPLIVEDMDSTTVVPPSGTAQLDERNNLVVLV